jgi:AcrR family transcriptional regulator
VPARKTPPEAWIDAALAALADGGPDAIRVEALAASLGVTKGGFYGEFTDRNALVERMLDTWEQTVVDNVIRQVENTDDEADTKLRHLFYLAGRHLRGGRQLAIELAVRDWARRNPAVKKRLNGVDNRRMTYLRTLFRQIGCDHDDAEARAFLAFSLFVGSNLITAEHDGRSRRDVIAKALDNLMRA